MRKILNCIVLFSFAFHQLVWAIPLDWEPEFESASVLPYHDDAQGRRWLLVSKKTYNEREYDAPSWGDFGGKVEQGEQQFKLLFVNYLKKLQGKSPQLKQNYLMNLFIKSI